MSNWADLYPSSTQDALSDVVEQCAGLVLQAMQAVSEGVGVLGETWQAILHPIDTVTGGGLDLDTSQQDSDTRAALNAFWQLKIGAYYGQTPDAQAQLQRLDGTAHGVLNALASGNVFRRNPTYWSQLSAMVRGVTPDRAAAIDQAEAVQAAKDAASCFASVGMNTMSDYFDRTAIQDGTLLAASDAIWKTDSLASLVASKIPWWAYAVGGLTLWAMLRRK